MNNRRRAWETESSDRAITTKELVAVFTFCMISISFAAGVYCGLLFVASLL